MRLYELLAVILGFYGGIYQDWLEEFGEERLLALLDRLDIDPEEPNLDFYRYALNCTAVDIETDFDPSGYQYLEDLVSGLDLPEEIEDYVWDNPHYRAYIESPIPIERRVAPADFNRMNIFYHELVFEGHRLFRQLDFIEWEYKIAAPAIQRQFLRARSSLFDMAGIPRFSAVRNTSTQLGQSLS